MQVLHGAATDVLKTLAENSIDTVYTCPSPFRYYNKNELNYIGAEETLEQYIENLVEICNACSRVLKPTGNLFIQIGDKFSDIGTLLGIPTLFEMVMRNDGFVLNDRIIWHRTERGRIRDRINEKGFLKNYEFIFHFIHKDFYFNTNSKYSRTSVFSYPLGDSYYTNEFDSGLPEELIKMVIDTTCPKNGIVLDPLCGSGKVGVVAKRMNRDFIGIDINLETVEACRIRLGI